MELLRSVLSISEARKQRNQQILDSTTPPHDLIQAMRGEVDKMASYVVDLEGRIRIQERLMKKLLQLLARERKQQRKKGNSNET